MVITLHEGFLSMQLLMEGLEVVDITLDQPVKIPTAITVYPWQLIALRRLMSEPFYALLHVLAVDNTLIDVVLLRRHHAAQVGSAVATVSSGVASIYPTKTLQEMA